MFKLEKGLKVNRPIDKRGERFFAKLREQVREEAVAAWNETGGDKERAIARVRERVHARFNGKPGISEVVLSLLIQIAIQLLLEWWNNRQLAQHLPGVQPCVVESIGYDSQYEPSNFDHCFDSTFFDDHAGELC